MAGGQCRGLQSSLPAFLDIPSVTVDEFQRLMPSFEAAIQAPMGLCAPSIVSGCTSHSGTRWFNRDKLNCVSCGGSKSHQWQGALGEYSAGLPCTSDIPYGPIGRL